MHLSLITHDPRLLFIVCVAFVVALLTTLNVAARPAAATTGRVATAFSVSALFFVLTRFANLFYLPLLGAYVDGAVRLGTGSAAAAALITLKYQIQWVVVGAAAGTLGSWLMLPTFVKLYEVGIRSLERHRNMLKVLTRLLRPATWPQLMQTLSPPSMMGTRLGRVGNVPVGFLLVNVGATAIWTVGALCAALASAREPKFAGTAVLLSGMVNSFALIAFTVWVNPVAALITDQAVKGQRPQRDVTVMTVHLGAGSFLGAALGLLLLEPGTEWIQWLTRLIGGHGGSLAGSLLAVAAVNCLVTLMQAGANMDRVSAVLTERVATALSVYNIFFMVTNVAAQIYAPILGSIADHAVHVHEVASIGPSFRVVVLGASVGVFLGILLMPTFVQIYCRAIRGMERYGSLNGVFLRLLTPRGWRALASCLRRPTLFGVRPSDIKSLPQGFLWGNLLAISITTVGVMSAIYAGAQLSGHLARTATLLSSVVNGVATITLNLVVNPAAALITDQCVAGERPVRHIYAMAVFLTVGMLLGTFLSQLVFAPATWIVKEGARILGAGFHSL